jgi:hypothetical protein
MHNVLGSNSCNYTYFLFRAKPVDSVLGPVDSMFELVLSGMSLYELEHSTLHTYMLNTCFHRIQEQMFKFMYMHSMNMFIQ